MVLRSSPSRVQASIMVFCFCGNVVVMGSRCGFLGWVDPLMCHRLIAIILGLLRTINMQEELDGSVMDRVSGKFHDHLENSRTIKYTREVSGEITNALRDPGRY
uniref:Uncharacterized protein n=1 Tax=Lactuca sativa TaxID=4236 RepID=A0A9R1VSP9_LACSA|nr:hypothetical protein LSAT_V11C400186360 [Lactuca sativa]